MHVVHPVALHRATIVEHIAVNRCAAKQKDIAVVCDDSIHEMLHRELCTLSLGFHRRRQVRQAKDSQESLNFRRHLLCDLFVGAPKSCAFATQCIYFCLDFFSHSWKTLPCGRAEKVGELRLVAF